MTRRKLFENEEKKEAKTTDEVWPSLFPKYVIGLVESKTSPATEIKRIDIASLSAEDFSRYFATACFKKDKSRATACLSRLQKEGIDKTLSGVTLATHVVLKGPALFIAASLGFAEIIPDLLKAGASPHPAGDVFSKEHCLTVTPIVMATRRLFSDVVNLLLKANASTAHVDVDAEHTLFYELTYTFHLNVPLARQRMMECLIDAAVPLDVSGKLVDIHKLLHLAIEHADSMLLVVLMPYVMDYVNANRFPFISADYDEEIKRWWENMIVFAVEFSRDKNHDAVLGVFAAYAASLSDLRIWWESIVVNAISYAFQEQNDGLSRIFLPYLTDELKKRKAVEYKEDGQLKTRQTWWEIVVAAALKKAFKDYYLDPEKSACFVRMLRGHGVSFAIVGDTFAHLVKVDKEKMLGLFPRETKIYLSLTSIIPKLLNEMKTLLFVFADQSLKTPKMFGETPIEPLNEMFAAQLTGILKRLQSVYLDDALYQSNKKIVDLEFVFLEHVKDYEKFLTQAKAGNLCAKIEAIVCGDYPVEEVKSSQSKLS